MTKTIETKTLQGMKVEITLEDWVEAVIDRALEKHKVECPVVKLGERVSLLENKMALVFWLGGPCILGGLAWIGTRLLNLIQKG